MTSSAKLLRALGALLLVTAATACDDDPSQPNEVLALRGGCPAGPLNVNDPISLAFTVPVSEGTVNSSAIVVSDANTGLEIPGVVSLGASGDSVTFVPSSALPYDVPLRIRVQNLRSAESNTQIDVSTCVVRTGLPPIQQVWWDELPRAGGDRLRGVMLLGADRGFTISEDVVLFSKLGTPDFEITSREPYFTAGFDVNFADNLRGFASYSEFRLRRGIVTYTANAGATFDTVAAFSQRNPQRIITRPAGTGLWTVIGGGSTLATTFWKMPTGTTPVPGSFTRRNEFAGTGNVSDMDFVSGDTTTGVATTEGNRTGTLLDVRGTLYRTTDGGNSWARIPGISANDSAITFLGVARRANGEVFITGGYGLVLRLRPQGTGYAVDTISRLSADIDTVEVPRASNVDFQYYETLIYTDVQFAPDNDQVGWIVGAQLVGTEVGTPRYQGLIFQTCDGGTTWERQGVRGAEGFGAEFPRLNRISARAANQVWLAGDNGVVLTYRPPAAPCP